MIFSEFFGGWKQDGIVGGVRRDSGGAGKGMGVGFSRGRRKRVEC